MHPFIEAIGKHDHPAIEAMLADDVTFTSPVAFKPYRGRHITAAILRGVDRVMGENLRYIRTFASADGREHALMFVTMLDGKELNGCDFLRYNDEGKIDDFLVMVRPLSAATALAAAMGAQFEAIAAEAAEAAAAEAG